MFHLFLTSLVLIIGLVAPWVDLKIGRFHLRPYIFASLVVLGLLPFSHWLVITPAVYRDQLFMVSSFFSSVFSPQVFF